MPSIILSSGAFTPTTSATVGKKSMLLVGVSISVCGAIWSGHLMSPGTRIPPSMPPWIFPPRDQSIIEKLKVIVATRV